MNTQGELRRATSAVARTLNGGFGSVLETRLEADPHILTRCPPLFVVGAPRSGTTLAYQLLAYRLNVCYVSNRHARFFGTPALIEKWFRPSITKAEFTSDHGRTSGPAGPSEAPAWWYRFFPRGSANTPSPDVSWRSLVEFRRSVATMTTAGNRPFVAKNVYASARIPAIHRAIPEARFLVVTRDILAISRSLLVGRLDVYGDERTWWSIPPRNFPDLVHRSPAEQVVGQAVGIYEMIEEDLLESEVPDEQVFVLPYETMLSDSSDWVYQVGRSLNAMPRVGVIQAPPEGRPPVRVLEASLEESLRREVDSLGGFLAMTSLRHRLLAGQ